MWREIGHLETFLSYGTSLRSSDLKSKTSSKFKTKN